MATEPLIQIDVWSDYVCPFCYLELPVLDELRDAYGDALEVRWHAFELRPDPVPTLDPAGDYLRDTWARSVYPLADERGMTLRLPPVQPRSRKAFEVLCFAREEGRVDAVHRAIFKAFFEDGSDIGNTDVLLDIAASCGLDVEDLGDALTDGHYTDDVIADERFATDLGVTGVPFAIVSRDSPEGERRAIALRGAAPRENFEAAITRLFPEGLPGAD
jgi:predicted DsbA family dithiol-disulfide isomerase